jgi:hypothetical protein
MSYQYTYPNDTTFIDRATEPGRIRYAAYRLFQASRLDGLDLWDVVEDDNSLSDEEKNLVHRVFAPGESDAEIADKRSRGVRYGR